MKTNKQKATQRVATKLTWMLILFAMIAFALIACGKDDPDPTPCTCPNGTVHTDKPCDCGGDSCACTYKQPVLCACNPKEHYLPCTCGGTDCTCEVKPRGYITEYQTNAQIPIYQTVGVTDEQAVTVTASIIAGYNGVGNAGKQIIAGKVQEIRIVSGATASCTPAGVVEIGADWPYDFEDIFTDIVKEAVTQRTLSFGTDCKVTITSNDTFTAAEWSTLCDKVVAAIDRAYNNAVAMQPSVENYFKDNTVYVVLLKSATYDVEVKSDVPNTIYFKANGSIIDSLTLDHTVFVALLGGGTYSTP